jgi:hypothetical protein
VQSGRSLLTFYMISEHLPDYMVSHSIMQYPQSEPFLMVMNIKIDLFWHVMPYSLVYIVACVLKPQLLSQKRQLLLGNGSVKKRPLLSNTFESTQ